MIRQKEKQNMKRYDKTKTLLQQQANPFGAAIISTDELTQNRRTRRALDVIRKRGHGVLNRLVL